MPEKIICPKCNTQNNIECSFCEKCGYYLKEIGGKANAHDYGDGITEREISLVTKDSSGKYARSFLKMQRTNKKMDLNLPVALLGFFFGIPFAWFFYRKMYKTGTVVALISLAILFGTAVSSLQYVGFLAVAKETAEIPKDIAFWQNLYQILNMVQMVFVGFLTLFSNYFYKNYCFKKIKRLNYDQNLLLADPSTNIIAAIVSVVVFFVVAVIITMPFTVNAMSDLLPLLNNKGVLAL